ncbi:hypothetical protein ACNQFZ_12785 [Schinkia sp. CFF1]
MKDKKFKVVIILLIILYLPSVIKFGQMQYKIHQYNTMKDRLESVDLSDIKVDGHLLGDKVETLNFSGKYAINPGTYSCDRSSKDVISYWDNFYMKNCKIIKMNVDLVNFNVVINNKRIEKTNDILNIVGNHYTTKLYDFSGVETNPTYTYVDHANNLELSVVDSFGDGSKSILEIKKLDRTYKDKYVNWVSSLSEDDFWFPSFCMSLLMYASSIFSSKDFISGNSLVLMPLLYFVLLIPAILALLNKQNRRLLVTLQFIVLIITFIVGPFLFIAAQ